MFHVSYDGSEGPSTSMMHLLLTHKLTTVPGVEAEKVLHIMEVEGPSEPPYSSSALPVYLIQCSSSNLPDPVLQFQSASFTALVPSYLI